MVALVLAAETPRFLRVTRARTNQIARLPWVLRCFLRGEDVDWATGIAKAYGYPNEWLPEDELGMPPLWKPPHVGYYDSAYWIMLTGYHSLQM